MAGLGSVDPADPPISSTDGICFQDWNLWLAQTVHVRFDSGLDDRNFCKFGFDHLDFENAWIRLGTCEKTIAVFVFFSSC